MTGSGQSGWTKCMGSLGAEGRKGPSGENGRPVFVYRQHGREEPTPHPRTRPPRSPPPPRPPHDHDTSPPCPPPANPRSPSASAPTGSIACSGRAGWRGVSEPSEGREAGNRADGPRADALPPRWQGGRAGEAATEGPRPACPPAARSPSPGPRRGCTPRRPRPQRTFGRRRRSSRPTRSPGRCTPATRRAGG